MVGPAPTGSIVRPAGRRLAYDDVGDPGGAPLVYLHGFPDSRLSRHPDDGIAAALGVRLVAVDRPGFGASECDGAATYAQEAEDVVALADHLGLDRFSVVGWSSGAALALACGAVAPCRVAAVGVLAGNPPLEADTDLGGAIDELYAARGEVVAELGARAFAEMVAPLAAPVGLDVPAALEYVREGRDATALADLDAVYGLHRQLAVGTVVGLEAGLAGAVEDLHRQVSRWGFSLANVTVPVVLWYGTHDAMFRPAVGRWLADRLPDATLVVIEGGSHLGVFTRWAEILTRLTDPLRSSHAVEP